MHFLTEIVGNRTSDNKSNEDIGEEMGIADINTIIKQYNEKNV
jgi:hypothetical protein